MAKLALCLTLALILCAVAASAAQAAGVYLALGDSYSSAPLVPNQHGQPIDCGRSDHNYPSLVAQEFKPDESIDVSCGSAETKHMTEPRADLPAGTGTSPPDMPAPTSTPRRKRSPASSTPGSASQIFYVFVMTGPSHW